MKVALHSAPSRLGDVAANVQTVADAVAGDDADLVVFPELFLTGYNIGDDVQRLAFVDDDGRLEPIRQAAARHKRAVVVGAPRASRRGIYHNSAILVDEAGEASYYDKRALANFTTFREGLFFQPGKTSPVWHTAHGAVGIGICYDAYFPEFTREQALAGADVLLNISASPATTRRFFEAVLPARAIENASYAAYCNLTGAQDGVVFWGGSQAWGPRGDLRGRSTPFEKAVLQLDLTMEDLDAARQFRPTLRDAVASG